MPLRTRIIFFAVAWAIVLMPFYFWRSTWFGRELTDQQMTEYLHDDAKPRHIQHALVQLGNRIGKGDKAAEQWYPELVRLAAHPVEEIRTTDAWVMGQDTSRPEFHDALLGLLNDRAALVRYNAALSLVRFGDASGRPQIVGLLQPAVITAPAAGKVVDAAASGTAVRDGGLVLKFVTNENTSEIRSPIAGRVRSVAATGQNVAAGAQVASIEPAQEQVWEALRALYLIGEASDVAAIRPYTRDSAGVPDHIRKQALETISAIEKRASR